MDTNRITRTLSVTITLDALGELCLDFCEPESGEESRLVFGKGENIQDRIGAEVMAYISDMGHSFAD